MSHEMFDPQPLTITEQNALKWVALCGLYKLDPLQTTALDFVPKEKNR